MEVPALPQNAFDPLVLVEETAEAVEANTMALNGQAQLAGGWSEDMGFCSKSKADKTAALVHFFLLPIVF